MGGAKKAKDKDKVGSKVRVSNQGKNTGLSLSPGRMR